MLAITIVIWTFSQETCFTSRLYSCLFRALSLLSKGSVPMEENLKQPGASAWAWVGKFTMMQKKLRSPF